MEARDRYTRQRTGANLPEGLDRDSQAARIGSTTRSAASPATLTPRFTWSPAYADFSTPFPGSPADTRSAPAGVRPQPVIVDEQPTAEWMRFVPIALIALTLVALAWWQFGTGDDGDDEVGTQDGGSSQVGVGGQQPTGVATQRPGAGGAVGTEEATTSPTDVAEPGDIAAGATGTSADEPAGNDATGTIGPDEEGDSTGEEAGATGTDDVGEEATGAAGTDDGAAAAPADATGPATDDGVIQVASWEGESLADVAARWGLDVSTLVWANDIEDPTAVLEPGTLITIPPVDGVVHEVQAGETLESIGALYDVDPVEIVNVYQNGIESNADLRPGMLLTIPGATPKERGGLATYTVKEGDDLSKIGSYYGISAYTIAYANDVPDNFLIRPGQELIIPPADGILYYANEGDTVESIAAAFGVDPETIRACAFNNVPGDAQPTPGQPILVPGLHLVQPGAGKGSGGGQPPATDPFAASSDPVQAATGTFMWPTTGSITSTFSSAHNGLDIANAAWTPVVAADGGRVTFAGWNNYGLGYAVAIDHENGYVTWYGHLAEPPAVTIGQRVAKGDWLGPMGSTGKSTGPHLHFIILQNTIYQDPLTLLP